MIAQIYTKTNGDYTSILVTNEKAEVYFRDVLEIPELTGVQRGVSFVKHQLDVEKTELYPDKLKAEELLKEMENDLGRINEKSKRNGIFDILLSE